MSMGYSLPTPSTYFPLREALRGAKRFLSRPTIQKHPLSPGLLMHLVASTNWGSPMRCLYLSLWFTLARLASLIPTSSNENFNPQAHLTWSNVSYKPDGVKITIQKTKTIQCQERLLMFFIPKHANTSICFHTQLLSWFNASPLKAPFDPVFLHLEGGFPPSLADWQLHSSKLPYLQPV